MRIFKWMPSNGEDITATTTTAQPATDSSQINDQQQSANDINTSNNLIIDDKNATTHTSFPHQSDVVNTDEESLDSRECYPSQLDNDDSVFNTTNNCSMYSAGTDMDVSTINENNDSQVQNMNEFDIAKLVTDQLLSSVSGDDKTTLSMTTGSNQYDIKITMKRHADSDDHMPTPKHQRLL